MLIKNANTPAIKDCGCGSWLNHWSKFSGQFVRMCIVKECNNYDMIGSHIQKADSSDTTIYIIPICKEHSESEQVLEIFDDIALVSANVKKTCASNSSKTLKDGER